MRKCVCEMEDSYVVTIKLEIRYRKVPRMYCNFCYLL